MKIIVYDIETSGQGNKRVERWAKMQPSKLKQPLEPDYDSVKAPSSWKDQAKIDARIAENKEKLKAEYELASKKYTTEKAKEYDKLINKSALKFESGAKVISVAFRKLGTKERTVFSDLDEKKLLIKVGDYLHKHSEYHLAGKTNTLFDQPFLTLCFLRHDLGVPKNLSNNTDYRPVLDIDNIGGFKTQQITSLNALAFGLQIEGKNGEGSSVAKLHKNWIMESITGKDDSRKELEEYNLRDVELTEEILARFHKTYVPSKVDEDFEDKINKL